MNHLLISKTGTRFRSLFLLIFLTGCSTFTLSGQNISVTQVGNPVVFPNTINNPILRIHIVNNGPQVPISNLTFSTNGSTNPATDIMNAKLYHSGADSIFNIMNVSLVGTYVNPWSTNYTFFPAPTSYNLPSGDHYFWLTYDIYAGAVVCNLVDAQFLMFSVFGIPNSVINGSPPGNSLIGPCTTSLSDQETSSEFTMVPNPANESVLLNASTSNIQIVEISDLHGKLKYRAEYNNLQSVNLDITAFDAGVYICNLLVDGKWHHQKLVVSKN